ncbi:helix-turn-helix domain-containing protein [Pectobacterium brasiliense]|uniref:helix-turn-helix domain-containing protein n=1 Tax=Pectobacterium brasiliense TaxID=180957 RepID=UPI003D3188EF
MLLTVFTLHIHKTHDKNHGRRLTAILMLHCGKSVTVVTRTLGATRSSVSRWINFGYF